MKSSDDPIIEFRAELKKETIQQAYRRLMEYCSGLRTHFQKTLLEYEVPGSLYQGYMDMTYFSIIPPALKQHKLKIAVVFLYDTYRFEVWLSGYNRQVQAVFWNKLRSSGIQPYHLVEDPLKADAILEHILVEDPDFNHPDELTRQIDKGVTEFIKEMLTILQSLDQ